MRDDKQEKQVPRKPATAVATIIGALWWRPLAFLLRVPVNGTTAREAVLSKDSRRSGLGFTGLVLSLAMASAGGPLLILSGVSVQSTVATVFVTYVVSGIVQWLLYRPSLRSGWSVWWRALVVGLAYAANVYAGRELINHVPLAVMTSVFFVFGPMVAALVRIRSNDRFQGAARLRYTVASVLWVMVATAGVGLVLNVKFSAVAGGGMLLIVVCLIATCGNYHVYLTVSEGVSKEKDPKTGESPVATIITLGQLPGLAGFIIILLLSDDGWQAVPDLGGFSLMICCVVGLLSAASTMLGNAVWKLGLSAKAQATIQPVKPAMNFGLGLVVGQQPRGTDWFWTVVGISLITAAAVREAITEMRNKAFEAVRVDKPDPVRADKPEEYGPAA